MIKKMINYLLTIMSSPETDLELASRLTEEEVSNIAQRFGKEENWLPEHVQKRPVLQKVGKNLLWKVSFGSKEEADFIMLGQHRFITIDDKTGEIKKYVGVR
jgi:hypothetical protein